MQKKVESINITASVQGVDKEITHVVNMAVSASSTLPTEKLNEKTKALKAPEQEVITTGFDTPPKTAYASKSTDQKLRLIVNGTSLNKKIVSKTTKAAFQPATTAISKSSAESCKQTPVKVSPRLTKTVDNKSIKKKTPARKCPVKKRVENKKLVSKRGKGKSEVEKPLSEDYIKLARFSELLETFISSANALQDEFGGIPDQIHIVSERFDKHHGKSLAETRICNTY
jgi:hypothetical protein